MCKYCSSKSKPTTGNKCKECLLATNRRWVASNREYNKARCKKWKQENKEKVAEYNRMWNKENSAIKAEHNIARVRKVKNAIPKWANKEMLKEFYQNCPPGFHVDHIIPLNHKKVSGLHVLENLQYLKAVDNIKKRNNADTDLYDGYVYPVCLLTKER